MCQLIIFIVLSKVTAQDEQGMPALIAAAYQNNLSVTDLLIPP